MGQATPAEAAAKKAGSASGDGEDDFKLVGYSKFVRTNLRTDRFPVLGFHHIEFWCADATNTAGRFSFGLGMPLAARSDLSTGNPIHSSLLLRSSSLQFLFSASYSSEPPSSHPPSPLPSFSPAASHRFTVSHGLGVRAVAVRVADAAAAFNISVSHGARPAFPPTDLGLGFSLSEVELYGDVVLRFISHPPPSSVSPSFLPGFEDLPAAAPGLEYGIRRLDHAVGNVDDLSAAVKYVASFTGFHEFAEFTAADVGTAESGLNSVVLANNEETVLIPMNEPVHGTKRRSQIQTFLEYNRGAGVQHLALATDDVLRTLRKMKAMSPAGGFEFMPPPPPTYYANLAQRAGDVLSKEQLRECEELGVLVDKDDQGVLLQIFTRPIGDSES
ncbi:hypothetical protein KSP39_PZI010082 [Platanthera zijinensis]|uniref:4-hydroxyphenylpyruvate dioxygenase n=1 Tax=Platanthera zijinensis TaxID=2320716 RepID=A0AAP0BIM1_9ASPA